MLWHTCRILRLTCQCGLNRRVLFARRHCIVLYYSEVNTWDLWKWCDAAFGVIQDHLEQELTWMRVFLVLVAMYLARASNLARGAHRQYARLHRHSPTCRRRSLPTPQGTVSSYTIARWIPSDSSREVKRYRLCCDTRSHRLHLARIKGETYADHVKIQRADSFYCKVQYQQNFFRSFVKFWPSNFMGFSNPRTFIVSWKSRYQGTRSPGTRLSVWDAETHEIVLL